MVDEDPRAIPLPIAILDPVAAFLCSPPGEHPRTRAPPEGGAREPWAEKAPLTGELLFLGIPPSVGWSVAQGVGSSAVRGLLGRQTRPGSPDHLLPAGVTREASASPTHLLCADPRPGVPLPGCSRVRSSMRLGSPRLTAPLLRGSGPLVASLWRGLLHRFPRSGRASVVRRGCETPTGGWSTLSRSTTAADGALPVMLVSRGQSHRASDGLSCARSDRTEAAHRERTMHAVASAWHAPRMNFKSTLPTVSSLRTRTTWSCSGALRLVRARRASPRISDGGLG